MFAGRRVLAVVPARGGSKSVPRKNLALVGGETLIARVANVVHELEWIDQAVVSTDDDEIADEGADRGLEVVRRPEALATDDALSVDVWQHAWLDVESDSEREFEIGVLLQPTSPLRGAADVTECVWKLVDDSRDVVVSVSPMPSHYTPEKTMILTDRRELVPYLKDGFTSIRQHVPDYFFLNGYCYAATRHRIVREGKIHGSNVGACVIDRPVVNIDEPFDLELAEWLLSRENDALETSRDADDHS